MRMLTSITVDYKTSVMNCVIYTYSNTYNVHTNREKLSCWIIDIHFLYHTIFFILLLMCNIITSNVNEHGIYLFSLNCIGILQSIFFIWNYFTIFKTLSKTIISKILYIILIIGDISFVLFEASEYSYNLPIMTRVVVIIHMCYTLIYLIPKLLYNFFSKIYYKRYLHVQETKDNEIKQVDFQNNQV